jgi:3-oxo-4-pregnene-20-carboxyl-CoA dehydrogenase alpha subunit
MNTNLSDEALQYGLAAQSAFENAGGDELVQQAEQDPLRRAALVEPVLDSLSALDLRPLESADELEASAALCRSAGWWAIPYPVAERLARPSDLAVDGLVVVGDGRIAGRVAGLDLTWAATDLGGHRYLAAAGHPTGPARTSQFVASLTLTPAGESGGRSQELALGLVLPCWTLLGMLDRAMALTRMHVLSREQFGQPLARFQGVQFQLTDAEVEHVGVEELAKYALWSIQAQRAEAVDDALALRFAAVEAAETVFRISHQLHGAMGFCDESALSWISRYSQPLRQLPCGLSGTLDQLTRQAGTRGITGLFSGAGR